MSDCALSGPRRKPWAKCKRCLAVRRFGTGLNQEASVLCDWSEIDPEDDLMSWRELGSRKNADKATLNAAAD